MKNRKRYVCESTGFTLKEYRRASYTDLPMIYKNLGLKYRHTPYSSVTGKERFPLKSFINILDKTNISIDLLLDIMEDKLEGELAKRKREVALRNHERYVLVKSGFEVEESKKTKYRDMKGRKISAGMIDDIGLVSRWLDNMRLISEMSVNDVYISLSGYGFSQERIYKTFSAITDSNKTHLQLPELVAIGWEFGIYPRDIMRVALIDYKWRKDYEMENHVDGLALRGIIE